jgi:hypothetical protein
VLVGDVSQVAEDFRLRGIALRPLPLGLELGIEAIGVVQTFDVAAGAGVAVPVPGAADTVTGFDDLGGEPGATEAKKLIEA